MKKTRYLAFCSIMAALGVVVMFLGSFIEVFDLTAVIAASVFVFVVSEELGKRAIAVWAVTAVISILILPSKLIAIEYLILGTYPIIKRYFDKLLLPIKHIVKLVYMLVVTVVLIIVIEFVFTGFGDYNNWYFLLLFGALGLVCFIVYDVALSRLARLYRGKLRKQLRIDKFFKQ